MISGYCTNLVVNLAQTTSVNCRQTKNEIYISFINSNNLIDVHLQHCLTYFIRLVHCPSVRQGVH